MLREKRHTLILNWIRQDRLVSVAELSQRLSVSYMTVWRDLDLLEKQGLVGRVRGGAVLGKGLEVRLLDGATGRAGECKLQIGRYAAQHLVEAGDTILVEAGTTASSLVPFLDQPNLTVLTNGLHTTQLLYTLKQQDPQRNLTAMCSGGILIETGAFTGPQAEDFFARFRVKKAFLGAQGVSLEDGYTDPTPLYSNLKKVMKASTERVIMLLDSSKFGVRSLVQVMDLNEVDLLVTDPGAPEEIVAGLRKAGIDVRLAEPFATAQELPLS
jgi:DeoR/GlpR family transcriptional regulator of sugar metabolism